MIEKKTVFVLGAGAHMPYGFPSGEDLKSQAATLVEHSHHSRPWDRFDRIADRSPLPAEVFSATACETFARRLKNTAHRSIDAFLKAHDQINGFSEIGKSAIAQILLRAENAALSNELRAYKDPEDDWMPHVAGEMVAGADRREVFVEKNRVSFITFNYDRLLEMYLRRALESTWPLEKDAPDVLSYIPILHVYGALGAPLPKLPTTDDRPWLESHKSIKTIHEAERDHASIIAARQLLAEAEQICVLGMRFHPDNIELIGLDESMSRKGVSSCASRFGLTEIELDSAREACKSHFGIAPHPAKCLGTLRNHRFR